MSDIEKTPTPRGIQAALDQGLEAFTIGHRLSLPFGAELISIMIGKQRSFVGEPDIITDFSSSNHEVTVVHHPHRVDLYFEEYSSLQKELGHWKGRLIVTCCENGEEIFDLSKHRRLELQVRDDSPLVSITEQEAL